MGAVDLFGDLIEEPAPAAPTKPAKAVKPALVQPPAIALEGPQPENAHDLMPLRYMPPSYRVTQITEAEFAFARRQYPDSAGDHHILGDMLEMRGVRMKGEIPPGAYSFEGCVDGPYMIRYRTIPGYIIVVAQGPAHVPDSVKEVRENEHSD